MVKRIQTCMVVAIAVAFAISLSKCGGDYSFLDRSRPTRWGEYGVMLAREVGPLEHIGGMHGYRGGCDVYRAGDGAWWLVGPGRRWKRCTPATAVQTSSDLVYEAAVMNVQTDEETIDGVP